ncbi:kinase-like domain-containing protein [Ochromonadaceae sp. CCMP2298]|nr:kinase-like domain-containing protein [Ochromonadaceae sp. CCMP2298]
MRVWPTLLQILSILAPLRAVASLPRPDTQQLLQASRAYSRGSVASEPRKLPFLPFFSLLAAEGMQSMERATPKYLDNPDAVLGVALDLQEVGPVSPAFTAQVLSLVRTLLEDVPGEQAWQDATAESVTVDVLCGGLTNALFLATYASSKVVVRVYGQGTAQYIDRRAENLVFSRLSKAGRGPLFLGRFKNGRLEGYISGTALTPDGMGASDTFPLVAAATAEMHATTLPELEEVGWLWRKLDLFFGLAEAGAAVDGDVDGDGIEKLKQRQLLQQMRVELDWLQSFLAAQREAHTGTDTNTDKDSSGGATGMGRSDAWRRGVRFGLSEALCHNDLLSGNLLRTSDAVVLIDYEYAAYNLRAHELANHLLEHCGFDFDLRNKFPPDSFITAFLRSYCRRVMEIDPAAAFSPSFSEGAGEEEFVQGLQQSVQWLLLAAHLFWGSWSMVQARSSTIDFDYAGYSRKRFDAYFYHKRMYVSEDPPFPNRSTA